MRRFPSSRGVASGRYFTSSWSMVLCALLTISASARAEPKTQVDEAEALFIDARRLLAERKPEQACPQFEQSQKLDPAAGTLMNLARCYALIGRTASAWSAYRAAASLSSAAGQTKREQVAQAQADALEPTLAKVTLYPPEGSLPAGFEILLDGTPWPGGTSATPVDPGRHVLVARALGFSGWSEDFVAVPRKVVEIRVPPLHELPSEPLLPATRRTLLPVELAPRMDPLVSAHASATGPANVPRRVRESGAPERKLRALGLVLSGAGIVGLVSSVVFGLRARQLNAESHEHNQCEATGCDVPGLGLNHAARDAASVATVAFVSGAALSAAGVTLYVFGNASKHSSVSLDLRPAFTARGPSLVLDGRM